MDNSIHKYRMLHSRVFSLSDINNGIALSLPTEPTKPDAFSLTPTLTDTTHCVKMSDLAMSLPCKINLYAPPRYLRRLRYRHWGRIFKFRHLVKHSKI